MQAKFSTKSDVWSFAVALWEILTFAREQPYEHMTDANVIENIGHIYQEDKMHVSSKSTKQINKYSMLSQTFLIYICRNFYQCHSTVHGRFTIWCANAGNATSQVDPISGRFICFYNARIWALSPAPKRWCIEILNCKNQWRSFKIEERKTLRRQAESTRDFSTHLY